MVCRPASRARPRDWGDAQIARPPRWSDVLYAVSVDPGRREVGAPSELFRGRYTSLDATADGNRFLALKPIERPEALPLLVWFNWVEKFGAR